MAADFKLKLRHFGLSRNPEAMRASFTRAGISPGIFARRPCSISHRSIARLNSLRTA
jgi:hypothetical protein